MKGPEIRNICLLANRSLQGSLERFQKKNQHYQYTQYKSMRLHWGLKQGMVRAQTRAVVWDWKGRGDGKVYLIHLQTSHGNCPLILSIFLLATQIPMTSKSVIFPLYCTFQKETHVQLSSHLDAWVLGSCFSDGCKGLLASRLSKAHNQLVAFSSGMPVLMR